MASYTMTLSDCLDLWLGNQPLSHRDKIEKGRKLLFDFEYPIFDPDYKKVFETNFIRSFYMREIGSETEYLFKFRLETWLLVNMPYYNKLLQSETLQFDPFMNFKMDTKGNKKGDKTEKGKRDSLTKNAFEAENKQDMKSSSQGSSKDDSFSRNIEADTPDGRMNLTSNDGEGLLEYASKIDEHTANGQNESTASTNGNSTSQARQDGTMDQTENKENSINSLEDYLESKIGKMGNDSYSKMLTEYRSTFLRVEKQIFDEMQELFMLIYG